MRGGRPGDGRGLRQAVPLRTPRGSEPQGGRPGQYGTHLPKEGGAGLRWCFGARELGRPLLAAGASSCSGVGEEALQPGGIAFLVGGRWVWPAGPMRAGRGLCAGCPRPAPPAPTPRLLQTARCTPAWTRWPRSRRSSSAAPSRMSRYCSQLPVPPWAGGSGPRARTPPQPFFLTAPSPNTLPHSVRQQHAGCGDGCQPPRASMGPPAPLSR